VVIRGGNVGGVQKQVGVSATVWLRRHEERERKRLAMSRDIDTLFGASRFPELCEDLNS
jgi:hypothetical protein